MGTRVVENAPAGTSVGVSTGDFAQCLGWIRDVSGHEEFAYALAGPTPALATLCASPSSVSNHALVAALLKFGVDPLMPVPRTLETSGAVVRSALGAALETGNNAAAYELCVAVSKLKPPPDDVLLKKVAIDALDAAFVTTAAGMQLDFLLESEAFRAPVARRGRNQTRLRDTS